MSQAASGQSSYQNSPWPLVEEATHQEQRVVVEGEHEWLGIPTKIILGDSGSEELTM